MVGLVRVTTVLEAADSYDLTTLAVIKDELDLTGSSMDQRLARYLSAASTAVGQFCNRVFPVETVKDEFWPARDPLPRAVPGGLSPLQLTRWPIVAVTSVVENGVTLVDGTDFRINAEKGQLIRLNSSSAAPRSWPACAIAVTYSAGYEDIPDDVIDAVLLLIKTRWFGRKRDPMMRSENVQGAWSAEYWFASGPGATTGNMPPDVVDLLDNYRVPVVA